MIIKHTNAAGKLKVLRSDRSEEAAIDMVKVSHLKQYFVVAFVGAPFELWDLKKLCLLRTMPKKFPPITSIEWSPLHNLNKNRKRGSVDSSKDISQSKSKSPEEESSAVITENGETS